MDPALNNYLKAADMAYDIGEIHALTPDCAHHDTLLRQQEVLGLLDQAVDGGYVQAYPMKALLSAADAGVRSASFVPSSSDRYSSRASTVDVWPRNTMKHGHG